MVTDREAILRSLSEPDMFLVVFDRHYEAIARYLARRLPRDIAADLASETFTRAFAGRARFNPRREDALPFLYGIAANLIRRHRRTEARMLGAYRRATAAETRPGANDAADVSSVAEALRELRLEEREVLLLFAWADLDYAQIAEALALPLGTVRSRLSRARSRMRERLEAAPQKTLEEAPRCSS